MLVHPSFPAKTVSEFICLRQDPSGHDQRGIGHRRKPDPYVRRAVQMQHVPVTVPLGLKSRKPVSRGVERRALSAYLRNIIEDAIRPERRKSREGASHERAPSRPRPG